jgi:hypothetical protein
MEFIMHVVKTEIYKFKQIKVLRCLNMEEHRARNKDNNWQYENTVHLWIQRRINFALQQWDTGMRSGYSSFTGGYLICN